MLNYEVIFISAPNFFGKYRNQTAIHISSFFKGIKQRQQNVIVIIDEMHKLFEKYQSNKTDSYESATAFWSQLDELEKNYPNIVVVGTANKVDTLPPELLSRFHGKIITLEKLNIHQQIDACMRMLCNDETIQLSPSITPAYIATVLSFMKKISLRDVQLLIDTAKIFALQKLPSAKDKILLDYEHFDRAIAHIKTEDKKSLFTKIKPALEKIGTGINVTSQLMLILSGAINIGITFGYLHSHAFPAPVNR
jgi:AAA+ superfamily predicted ATPase